MAWEYGSLAYGLPSQAPYHIYAAWDTLLDTSMDVCRHIVVGLITVG